jgi:HPr kinase/phosphorylase
MVLLGSNSGQGASIAVSGVVAGLSGKAPVSVVAGASGLDRKVTRPLVEVAGLVLVIDGALAGQGAVMGLDALAVSYLESTGEAAGRLMIRRVTGDRVPCVLAAENAVPAWVLDEFDRAGVPVLVAGVPFTRARAVVEGLLAPVMAGVLSVHGSLIDVFGVGILLVGKSGVGKSECALDLVRRGHKLVADDVVRITCTARGQLEGEAPVNLRHHMEISGLGILNVRELFGVLAVRDQKRIDVVAEMVATTERAEFDRLGIDDDIVEMLDVEVPLLTIPVRPGRGMATIIEVAVLNHVLKLGGRHTAREFQEQLAQRLAAGVKRECE